MIPLYLKISGIYSYRGTQEIDFSTLTAAHLFGIFGPVGSGKSAILEAIMYALYGETERLNSRELRAYNMMNLKGNDSFIQFDFLAPGDKGAYRAVVKGKRNSKNKEDVRFERTLYRISGKDLIPVETGEITAILGISYENFRRTIIIPQGKFQEFLQLGPKDRTGMVKELFSLHRFDLSLKTARLQKKNENEISNCEGRLQQLGEISGEVMLAREEELSGLTLRIEQNRLQLRDKEASESEMQRLGGLVNDLARNRHALNQLNAQKEEIQQAETRLNDYDACVTDFKSDLGLLDNQQRQFQAGQSESAAKQHELALAVQRLAETELRFSLARQAYDGREALAQQAKELELIARVNTDRAHAAELSARIANGEKQLKEAILDQENLKAQIKAFTGRQESARALLPDLNRLQQARDWFNMSGLLNERIETQRQKGASLNREFQSVRDALAAIAERHEIQDGQTAGFSRLIEQLENRKQALAASLQTTGTQLLHLEVQDRLKSLASELEDGKPCPLCGSTTHPGVAAPEALEKELHSCRDRKSTLEKQVEELGKSVSHAGLLIVQQERKQPELEASRKAVAEAMAALQNHEKGFLWSGLTEDKLREEWQAFNNLQKEIEQLNGLVKDASAKAETIAEKVRRFTEALEKLRIEHSKTQQNAETLLAQVSLSDSGRYTETAAEELRRQSAALRQQYDTTGEEYAAAEKTKNTLSADVQTLSGMVENMKLALGKLASSIAGLQAALESRIHTSRFESEAEVRRILALQPDRTKEQQRIRQFRETLATVATAVQQLEHLLEGKNYDAAAHEQLRLEIGLLRTLQEELNGQKGAIENVIRNLKQALEESVKLKSALDLLVTRRENLKTLADLFRGQGFVNFVSTLHLQNLVNSANERFYRLTRQQLKLELDEENNFRIRDYLNEGQWRNVKTLSGGQTFQASLCLALALADNIQQLNQSGQNFFFLDEGFGTLDRESLELVFETLKTLRHENRIVGVISHVEDLQQEIAAWLTITRDDEQGSIISRSWA